MVNTVYADISKFPKNAYTHLLAAASPERQERALHYRKQEDALRCLTGEALLRYALGETLPLAKTPQGKPYIPSRPQFHFNFSHSGNYVALSWANTPVGVDVQMIPTDTKKTEIAHRYFTGEECAYIFDGKQLQRFTQIWTAKESYIKYLGLGLGKSLRSFQINDRQIQDPPGNPIPGLCLHSIPLPDAYLCVCTEESQITLQEVTYDKIMAEKG